MIYSPSRISWNTNVKHYIRNGLYDNLPNTIKAKISKSNKHRWKHETADKYIGCEVANFIKEELELIKRTGESKNAKKAIEAFFKLSDTYHEITSAVKGIKRQMMLQKEKLVNVIEKVKDIVPVESALKVFNISRATYHNYKVLVINKCESSYFLWCVKQYPHQLLKKEILRIKKYMENEDCLYWSKSSVYLLALRNKEISFGLITWYKYSKLLGYSTTRRLHPKKRYGSLMSYRPNEIWCADVTIVKTLDGKKHYIHFLMDHYSKMILGYRIENSSSPKAIRDLLEQAYLKHKNKEPITFVTDGGVENVNTTVHDFLDTINQDIKHLITQKDITFSNSKIEAFNKIIKHQFLLPQNLCNRKQLETALVSDVLIYNTIRPQLSLQGNTPQETFLGKLLALKSYRTHFPEHKILRISENQQNSCKGCR
ncbi:DDE-type integrase/transposase/recombinase [Flavobacterium sp. LB2P84]|uniref:DDE-type integrase/transposase/recombinase n=1 Tax=Flavobacterium yafengii TaxID=3041253 RepID=UPI0024A7B511|nr:DDE-type integrase/transposase/recombinase [Flavobacterium yafengii]MDI6033712.1 DDE-type integrase/transposase/recombinase [Flavobacterium yafengii]